MVGYKIVTSKRIKLSPRFSYKKNYNYDQVLYSSKIDALSMKKWYKKYHKIPYLKVVKTKQKLKKSPFNMPYT